MAVQVNGKLRGTIHVAADLDDETVVQTALADEKIARFLEKTGGALRKSIVVKNKLVNLSAVSYTHLHPVRAPRKRRLRL